MSAEVLVVGGGVVGCTVALRLAQRGLRTRVLERSVPGAEASTVAAGILAPLVEHEGDGDALALGRESRELHGALARELSETLAIDVGFRRSGVLRVALEGADDDRADAALLARAIEVGDRVERLDAAALRRAHADVTESARGAVALLDEAQLEPTTLLRAIAIAAERAGARFESGRTVREVVVSGDRARGVRVDGEVLEADHVVVAAGSWTSLVGGLPASIARVRPVRGQVITCELRPALRGPMLFGAGGYVVPRPDGRIVCGATTEHAGFAKELTLGGLASVAESATALVPRLASAAILSHAVSFRPLADDARPLVGRTGVDGLWLASGHYRNGILLAPITAEILAREIAGEVAHPLAASIDPRRSAA